MPVCAVPTCATTHRATDKFLYKFPKDANFARIWVRCCLKKESFNTKSAYICSLHFAGDAYQRDINHDILGCPAKRNLRKDAIPTLQLPSLRMLQKNSFESLGSDGMSMLINMNPSLSPKIFADDIKLDLFKHSRVNKFHKFCHSHMKYRTNSISSNHCSDASSDPKQKNGAKQALENGNSKVNAEFAIIDDETSAESEKHIL